MGVQSYILVLFQVFCLQNESLLHCTYAYILF